MRLPEEREGTAQLGRPCAGIVATWAAIATVTAMLLRKGKRR